MAVADVIRLLGVNPMYPNRVVHTEISEPELPQFGTLAVPPGDSLASYLTHHRIHLYSHQCDAINRIWSGKNVIITTPTASGKTLAFNFPVFEESERDNGARALYLYPTKALSNDQLATLEQMVQFTGIQPGRQSTMGTPPSQNGQRFVKTHESSSQTRMNSTRCCPGMRSGARFFPT